MDISGSLRNFPQNIFIRSAFVYVLIAIFLSVLVDWKKLEQARVHYLLGVFANRSFQDYKDGVLYFESAIVKEPNQSEHYAGLAFCYFNLGEDRLAIWNYQKAVQLAPYRKEFREQLAKVYRKMYSENENSE